MSATSTETTRRVETTGGVIGVGLGLLVILGALLRVLLPEPPPPDAAAWLAERFDVRDAAPWGFAPSIAQRMLDGQVLVTLCDPAGPPPEPAPLPLLPPAAGARGPGGDGAPPSGHGADGPAAPSPGGPQGPPGMEWVDWTRVAAGAGGATPAEIAFTTYPAGASERVLAGLFGQVHFRDLGMVGPKGGEVPLDSGYLTWGAYEAAYVLARVFEKVDDAPTFHETLRVNLTLGKQATVLHLRWPRTRPGNLEDAKRVLAAFGPKPPVS